MSDIVRVLRQPPFGTETSERNLMANAADEITRLRAENEIHLKAVEDLNGIILHMQKANSELRAEIAAERERRQFAEDGLKLFRDAKIQWRVRAEAAESQRDELRAQLDEAREALRPLADAKFMFGSIETYSVSGRDVRYARMTLDSVLDKIKGGDDD